MRTPVRVSAARILRDMARMTDVGQEGLMNSCVSWRSRMRRRSTTTLIISSGSANRFTSGLVLRDRLNIEIAQRRNSSLAEENADSSNPRRAPSRRLFQFPRPQTPRWRSLSRLLAGVTCRVATGASCDIFRLLFAPASGAGHTPWPQSAMILTSILSKTLLDRGADLETSTERDKDCFADSPLDAPTLHQKKGFSAIFVRTELSRRAAICLVAAHLKAC